LLILTAASLPACSRPSTPLAAISSTSALPAPAMDPQTRARCPDPAKVTDGSPAGIAAADADLAVEYRKCQARHDGAVSAFDALAEAYQQLRSAITVGVKGGNNGK
jgi:hypothetical protein